LSPLPWEPSRPTHTRPIFDPHCVDGFALPSVYQDPVTKQLKPVAFLEGRINGQYIIEGLSAGCMYALGGGGLILLDWAQDKTASHRNRQNRAISPSSLPRVSRSFAPPRRNIFAVAGLVFCFLSYNLVVLFIRIKVPNYLLSDT
jgi:hypothetical protein